MRICDTIIGRADVAAVVWRVLALPIIRDLVPKDRQVRPVPGIASTCIWALLLVVHPEQMAQLMRHVPLVLHAVTPAQVALGWVVLAVGPAEHGDMARAVRLLSNDEVSFVGRLSVLHKHNAS